MVLSRRLFIQGLSAALLFAAAGGDIFTPAPSLGAEKKGAYLADPNIDTRRVFRSRHAWPSKDILNFHGDLSPGFHNTVIKAWENTPSSMRELIKDGGYVYDFATTMDEMTNGKAPLPIDPTDSRTINECFAIAYSQKWDGEKRVMVAEYELQNKQGIDLLKEKVPTIDKIVAGVWKRRIDVTAVAFNHETGHAINYCIEELAGLMLSDTQEFIEAYNNDIAALGGIEGAEKKKYGYFCAKEKDIRACRDEVMAEMLADTLGGCYIGKKMTEDWSSCHGYVVKAMEQFENAFKLGGVNSLKQIIAEKTKTQPEERNDRRQFLGMMKRAVSQLSC